MHSSRKRAGISSVPPIIANAPKVVWAIDFQLDSTSDGKAIEIASTIDDIPSESLLTIVERSITGERLVEELKQVFAAARLTAEGAVPRQRTRAFSKHCNGLREQDRNGLHPPGCLWDNGYIESFNNRLRKECFNRNHWNTLFEARVVIGDFKHEDNYRHRYSAWATAYRLSTLPPADAPTRRWSAALTGNVQTNPAQEPGGLRNGDSPGKVHVYARPLSQ